jgi:uncharacterized phage protein (TIGR02220 family)
MNVNYFFDWLDSLPTDKLITKEEVYTVANKYLISEDKNDELIDKIIDYLNSQAGTTFTNRSKKTKQLVLSRVNEGYSFVDFKIVIDRKVKQWFGTEQAVYLRPITLFNATKFETYLNETNIINTKKENGKRTKLDKIKSEITEATQADWGLD